MKAQNQKIQRDAALMLTKKIKPEGLQNPMRGFLSWSCDSAFKQVEIGPFISIGRDTEQTLTLEDPFLSRRHARIENQNSQFILKDMQSQNGTFLNGSQVVQAVLKDKDRIRVGKTEMTFSFKRFSHNWKRLHQSKNKEWDLTLKRLPAIAAAPFPVLIEGPSGTGKELIAQMIHSHSKRSKGPYVSMNCSAIAESLCESEFFGHVKGAYTGADQERNGAFRSAHKGTLFLDEIGDLPLSLQPKLLRVLEMKELKPLGSDRVIPIDVRIVAATHQNLREKIQIGRFRQDLYYRLRVLEVSVPSLLERMEDFEDLLYFFSKKCQVCFDAPALLHMKNHSWPGNIRELKNAVARAAALFRGEIINTDKVKDILDTVEPLKKEQAHFRNLSKDALMYFLKQNKGNQTQTASDLGVTRPTLRRRLQYYRIITDDYQQKE